MKKVLGLDLGSNSIGWALVNQAEKPEEKSSIAAMGVRLSTLTTDEKGNFEKGKSITTTADRTLKRGMRRNLQRYRQRRDNLINVLKNANIINDESVLCEDGPNSTFETIQLRAKAARNKVSLEDLARVLISINKKRGYKSNRKAKNSEEDGQLIDGMDIARKLANDNITPGQYAYSILQSGKKYIPTFYASDLIDELDKIWGIQANAYPQLNNELRESIASKTKTATISILKKALGIDNAEVKLKERRINYYRWRSEAATKTIDLAQCITVIGEINGDISNSSGYLGKISDHSKELAFNRMTVGEHMWEKLRNDPHHSFKNVIFYRNDYIDEFNTIWDTQRNFYPEILTDELKDKICDTIIFYQRRLRSQKGLIAHCEFESKEIIVKTPEGKEKKVISGPRVCPKSSPLFQEFKIWQTINNLELNGKPLSMEQRNELYRHLNWVKAISEKDALKILNLPSKGNKLNFNSLPGNTTQAALISAYKRILEVSGHDIDDFDSRTIDDQRRFIVDVFTEVLNVNDISFLDFDDCADSDLMQQNKMFRLWHLLYSFDDNSNDGSKKLIKKLQDLTGLPEQYASILASTVFEQDFGSLSTKAMLKILPFMKRDGLKYSDACEKAGYRHSKNSITKEENEARQLKESLDLLPKGYLRNPVVEKILNQMIHVVNGILEEMPDGSELDEIHIELARSLKQSREQREKTTESINKVTREAEEIKKILVEDFGIASPSRNDVIRYRLYQELAPNAYKTLYSGTFIPKEKLFGSREFDIEHIIPQAKLFDDSYSNKTIELSSVNIEKGDSTAYDYIKNKWGEKALEDYKNRIAFLAGDKSTQTKYKKLLAREENGKLLYENGKEVEGFLNRDLNETQYITRKAAELLKDVTRTVVITTGSITDRLRQDWQLVDVLKELNWNKYNEQGLTRETVKSDGSMKKEIIDWSKRNDHRHHAMDAVTVAFTRLQHIQYLNRLNSSSTDKVLPEERKGLIAERKFLPPIPLDELRAQVKKQLEQILISIKAKNKVATPNVNKVRNSNKRQITLTPRAQLHNETVYGKRFRYVTKVEKVGAGFDEEKIATVACKAYREALLKRLKEFGGDAKKAFTGKNSLEKNPLYVDQMHTKNVPQKVKTVMLEQYFTIRKPIDPNLKIDKVVDDGVRRILKERLNEFGNAKAAFSNLDENPIYLNKEKGITIKRVTITGVTNAIPLHEKISKSGTPVTNEDGTPIPNDYVSTSNNHHVAIFQDPDGNLQEHVVPFIDVITAVLQGHSIVDKTYNADKGWKFLFSMKQNEYFVFPDEETGFFPEEIDLMNPANYAEISKHLFRVQKFTNGDYFFRHHLETTVESVKELHCITWFRITSVNKLKGIVKVRVNHLGQIVDVGEY